jgi:hypothetical protein
VKLSSSQRAAYCVATHSKPYLSVGPVNNSGGGRRRSYKFVEAIKTFGRLLEEVNLDRAYERAGPNFTGELFRVIQAKSQPEVSSFHFCRAFGDDFPCAS